MSEKETPVNEGGVTIEYLKRECEKLNSELRRLNSDIAMLKETIVKMAMRGNGVC